MFGKRLVIFRKGGGGTPFTENSTKIINLIFEPFPNIININFNVDSEKKISLPT